jgi:hypothetical protein
MKGLAVICEVPGLESRKEHRILTWGLGDFTRLSDEYKDYAFNQTTAANSR